MWWSDARLPRRALLVGAAVALAGCGFTPAYAPGSTGSALRGQVSVTTPSSTLGFRLKGRIEERLGRSEGTGRYRLDITLDVTEEGVAVTPEGAVTRFTFTAIARFSLIDRDTGETLVTGTVDNFTSYSTTDSTVATQTARDDAQARLARLLGDQLLTRLLAAG